MCQLKNNSSSYYYGFTTLYADFGLLNQFLPSSSILDKGLPIWHFSLNHKFMFRLTRFGLFPLIHPTFFG
jgi:hypothetical protein